MDKVEIIKTDTCRTEGHIEQSASPNFLLLVLKLDTRQQEIDVSFLDVDYKPGLPMRPIGSAGQKRQIELPEYLKNRISYNQNSYSNLKKPIIKASVDDQGLSYGRKLHAAIYQRNQQVTSSRSPARNQAYQAMHRKKIGMVPSPSLPYHNQRKYNMDIHKSPYVKAANLSDKPFDRKADLPDNLRLLKPNLPNNFN